MSVVEPRPNHACERARQRYGVELTGQDLAAMCALIKRGKAIIEKTKRDGAQRVVVLYNKRAYFVVYAPDRNCILTFLPFGWGDRLRESTRREYARNARRYA